MHTYTWVSTEGISNVLHTKHGSLAGMPLADVTKKVSGVKTNRKIPQCTEPGLMNQAKSYKNLFQNLFRKLQEFP